MNNLRLWRRLNNVLDPKSPRDWWRFLLLAVAMLAIVVGIQAAFDLIRGESLGVRIGSVAFLIYFWVGGAWWRTLFQYLDGHRHDLESEAADRKFQRIGSIVWIVLAYVVLFIQLIDVTRGSADSGDGDGSSIISLVIVLLLPLGLAWITAVFGRYTANRLPRQRR